MRGRTGWGRLPEQEAVGMDIDSGRLVRVCSTEEVKPGCPTKFEIEDLVLSVFNVDGEFYVTDDECTHGPGSLSEGRLEGFNIICDFHDGAFDVRSGEVTAPPCMYPLRTYKVIVKGTDILIVVG